MCPRFRSVGEREFIERYQQQLSALRPSYVHGRIVGCASGKVGVALCCFERPCSSDGWCHRALTAKWLSEALEIEIPEFGFQERAQSQHPMLPPSLKA